MVFKKILEKFKKMYDIWQYGFDHEYKIHKDGVYDTFNKGIFSYHNPATGMTARDRVRGGWPVDQGLEEDFEPDPNNETPNYEVRRYLKWQYLTIREKKSLDPQLFREFFHPSRPPVITTGLSPHFEKPRWQQQQLALYNRWLYQGVPPKPGNAYHMHDCPHKDHAEDFYWPGVTYDEVKQMLHRARYMESRAGRRDAKKAYDVHHREKELKAPPV